MRAFPGNAAEAGGFPQPWSVEELAQWLRHAQEDRFAGMWVLAATTGMRRSELLGVRRDSLDLDAGTLTRLMQNSETNPAITSLTCENANF
jgi:integrase